MMPKYRTVDHTFDAMQVFHPHAGLVQLLLWTLLYAVVAIVGYHAAALVVDR